MGSTWTQIFHHIVFGTKLQREFISPELEGRLYPFIGGIVKDLGCTLYEINGMPEHVHLLVRFRADVCPSDLVRNVKSRSSGWIHDELGLKQFGWQEGYGCFSVSKSMVEAVSGYIKRQKEHHKKQGFREEYRAIVNAHGLDVSDDELFG